MKKNEIVRLGRARFNNTYRHNYINLLILYLSFNFNLLGLPFASLPSIEVSAPPI